MLERITRFFSKPKDVYCQTCGNDLTDIGGTVATNGKIYCYGYSEGKKMTCLEKDLILNPAQGVTSDYLNPTQVQQAIRNNDLTQFGPLEEKTQE